MWPKAFLVDVLYIKGRDAGGKRHTGLKRGRPAKDRSVGGQMRPKLKVSDLTRSNKAEEVFMMG
jgi:hypothetical protein